MDSWDPAFLDHQSRSFNSYQEGDPGSVMQNCTESGTKTVNLYVGQVPASLNKVSIQTEYGANVLMICVCESTITFYLFLFFSGGFA